MDLLEVIANKQNNDPQIKLLIDGLLRSPWQCPDKLINKYVTKSLAKILKKYKKSVLYFVFSNKKFCWFNTYISAFGILLYERDTDKEANFLPQLKLYQEIITEDLEKENINFDKLTAEGQAALFGLYIYASIAIYDVADITANHANNSKKLPHFLIKPCYLDAYLIRQFRRYCNEHSYIADCLLLKYLSTKSEQHDFYKNSDILTKLAYHLVDKHLSINIRYLEQPLPLIFKKLYERVQLLIYLYCYLSNSYSEQNFGLRKYVLVNTSEVLNGGFTLEEIGTLITDKEKRTGFFDSLLDKTEIAGILKLKQFNLKYTLKIHAKLLLDESLRTQDKWFEKSYVIPYLQSELNAERFIIGKGFQRNNKYKNMLSNYDVDVVIYDKKTELFYFCQLKHRLDFLMTNFRNELDTFSNEKIQDGIAQLTGLKQIINQELIKQQIITAFQNTSLTTSYIRTNDFSKNSRFLFIHNMEDFDFCSSQGITLYEWNTFRNLLKGYMSSTRTQDKNIEFSEQNKELVVDFFDLKAVKEVSPVNNTSDSEFKISKEYLQTKIYSHSKLVILNKKIRSFRKLECLAPYLN